MSWLLPWFLRSKRRNEYANKDDKTRSSGYELEEDIRSNLKHVYQNVSLPTLPWLEEIELPIQFYTKLQLKSESEQSRNKFINLHNLFDADSGKKPRRILIESQPGFGKTTLTLKIISDWANDKEYVRRFKFAFLVILRYFKSKTLMEEMVQLIHHENSDADELWRIINNDKTLLILDGLDEIIDQTREDILDVLYDVKQMYKMVIIVTCRVGRQEFQELKSFLGVAVKKDYWCKRITILGMDKEAQDEFLDKFIADETKDKMMSHLLKAVRSREDMFKSPLMLVLLAYLMRDACEIKIETKTDLYKQITDYIIRRRIAKTSAKTNPAKEIANFTLFDSSVNEYSSTFYKFGEMSWEHILNNELQFNPNADADAIYQMGFLLKHEMKRKLGTVCHYEGFHLSILEFAAAVFLKNEFQSNKNRFNDHLIKQIIEICIKMKANLSVIPFLCGLLENDVALFFDQLANYHVSFWITEDLAEYIFQQCETSKLTHKCVNQVIPLYFKTYRPSAVLTVANQHSGNILNVLETDLTCLVQLTNPTYVSVLYLTALESCIIPHAKILQTVQNIKCGSLICDIHYDLYYDTLVATLETFVSISSEHKTLRLGSRNKDTYIHLQNCVSNGVLEYSQFDLYVVTFNTNGETEAIAKIIQHNRVSNLIIAVDDPGTNFVVDILHLVAEDSSLNSVCIFNLEPNRKFCLDLDVVMENIGKKLEVLLLDDVRVECKSHFNSNNCVKSLSINAGDDFSPPIHDANVVLNFNPSILRCKYSTLEVLYTHLSASSWGGWDSIIELTLTIDKLTIGSTTHDFSKFKNLKILTLELFGLNSGEISMVEIFENLRFLKLSQVEIRWRNGYCIRDIQYLIQQNDITCTGCIRFVVIWDKPISEVESGFTLQPIKHALQSDCKISFYFLFYNWEETQMFVRTFIADLVDFNIKYEFIEDRITSNATNMHLRNKLGSYLDFHFLQLKLR